MVYRVDKCSSVAYRLYWYTNESFWEQHASMFNEQPHAWEELNGIIPIDRSALSVPGPVVS